MTDNDKMTVRDLNGEEITFLLRYRNMLEEDKKKLSELMEKLKKNNSNEK